MSWAYTYYFYPDGTGQNAKYPWIVASRADEWQRVLLHRGLKPEHVSHVRDMTVGEAQDEQKLLRHTVTKYTDLESLLEDEREILGEDSDAYRKLESQLKQHERKTMAKAAIKPEKTAAAKNGKPIANSIPSEEARADALNEAEVGHTPEVSAAMITGGRYEPEIPIGDIKTSPTNPRRRIDEKTLGELAGNIGAVGILEPLLIRELRPEHPDQTTYELVCGERRWRAAQIAELKTVPAIVKELTDDQVLEVQIHENLHREDVHPMDEAYGYKVLQDKLGCTTAELAVRVGKSDKYVLTRLKLNTLIEEAQADIDAGHLPLVYALEIAKCAPDAQKLILDSGTYIQESKYVKNEWVYFPIKTKIKPFGEFTNWIATKILWRLSAAPFDLKAVNLRKDGLACVNCPNRTGTNAALFDKDLIGKNDSCLDPGCYKGKAETLVQITRERVAHEASIETSQVPVINLESWQDNKVSLGTHSFSIVGKKPYKSWYGTTSEKTCDKSVTAINVGDGQYGKTYAVCLKSSGCKTHYPGTKAVKVPTGKAAEKERERELVKKRERREELVDVRVGNIVRTRVFRPAAEKFIKKFRIAGGDNLLVMLLAKMWISDADEGGTTRERVIKPIMAEIMDVKPDSLGFGWRQEEASTKIAKLSPKNQAILLFLLVHGGMGAMYYESYKSQKFVRALAEECGIDYRLIDAEVRLEIAEEKMKKHVPSYKLYLDAVRAGDAKAVIPRPYAPTYKPRD
jgi:ParB family chromosome partitioning protein